MLGKVLLLWLAALPLMGSPGPATLSLASMGAAFGLRRSLRYLAGIIVGTTAVLLVVATGVTAALASQPAVLWGIQIAAAGYILFLAWRIVTSDLGGPAGEGRGDVMLSFAAGFGLAIANPKAFAAIGAVYSGQVLVAESYLLDSIVKVAALTTVILVVNTTWLAFGASFSRYWSHPVIGRGARIVFALLLVLAVGLAMLGD